jgi:thiamine biosynthesis protein ThiI
MWFSCWAGLDVSGQEFGCVIVRFGGELWLKKGWTRRRYVRLLLRNMKRTLKRFGVGYDEFVRLRGRVVVRTGSAVEAASCLARVFGVSSVSPAFETSSELGDIVGKCVFLAGRVLRDGDSFAVECRRVGTHPYSSGDVCREAGRRILEVFGEDRGLQVNLGSPDVRLGVEVRYERAYIYDEVVEGVGGFPLGSQGRVVGLLSGGVDSAVAVWLAMKRGAPAVMVYFDNAPFTEESVTEKAKRVAGVLADWAVGFPRRLYVVPHGANLEEIVAKCPRRLTCVLCKRMMYRVAERFADRVDAEGLVTGEALGEQASQTLHNLRVLNGAVREYPIHRPMFGFDKAETEQLARRIGVYEVSSKRTTGCGAVPEKPATKAKLEDVVGAEERLDIEGMVEQSLKELRVVSL